MRRVVIIDHDNHTLFVEDINEEILEGQYGGDEQLYIEDNYTLGNYAWDWVTSTQYFSELEETPVEINFEELCD